MDARLEMEGGGTLAVRQDGPRVRLEAERPADGRGLYKVWLRGRQGERRLLLGTLAPEGGRLRLCRVLSLDTLERSGCWPVTGAEAPLAFPFQSTERWVREPDPGRLLADPVLRRQVRGAMLCRRGRGGFSLAAPLRTDGPVPLESLFCLARAERLEGRPYLVWEFDQKGAPVVPHKEEKNGQTNSGSGPGARG